MPARRARWWPSGSPGTAADTARVSTARLRTGRRRCMSARTVVARLRRRAPPSEARERGRAGVAAPALRRACSPAADRAPLLRLRPRRGRFEFKRPGARAGREHAPGPRRPRNRSHESPFWLPRREVRRSPLAEEIWHLLRSQSLPASRGVRRLPGVVVPGVQLLYMEGLEQHALRSF
eukprot:scaffold1973_cov399-Prasinococcus_capsulatus_cf.AAC.33